ncbi:hypothetical protein CEXT_172331 [Caerostris extrusa]|uniref:Uncharacterized protein n=1 Tax=Caerostris extrusa TaxID=172846 RepID=A0AAV4WLK2_CAEEX|nr:hypothetical protein CEXT_172331 [Caerostris extrusa]
MSRKAKKTGRPEGSKRSVSPKVAEKVPISKKAKKSTSPKVAQKTNLKKPKRQEGLKDLNDQDKVRLMTEEDFETTLDHVCGIILDTPKK